MANRQQLMDDEGISTSEKVKVRHLLQRSGAPSARAVEGWCCSQQMVLVHPQPGPWAPVLPAGGQVLRRDGPEGRSAAWHLQLRL